MPEKSTSELFDRVSLKKPELPKDASETLKSLFSGARTVDTKNGSIEITEINRADFIMAFRELTLHERILLTQQCNITFYLKGREIEEKRSAIRSILAEVKAMEEKAI